VKRATEVFEVAAVARFTGFTTFSFA